MYIDINSKVQIDIDDYFGVHDFKSLLYDEGYFYLIANKRNNKLGFYLLKISETEPLGKKVYNMHEFKDKIFLISWENKLDIGDVNIFVREDLQWDDHEKKEVK
jgi:hypothetical protein